MKIKFLLKLLTVFALVAGLCLLGCEGPTGPNGPNGDDGANGANSTEKGDQGETGPAGQQGPEGNPGADYDGDATALDGHDGPKGFNGASVIIMGVVATEEELPYPGGSTEGITDAYIVGDILYVWDITNLDWINTMQPVKGIPGEQGGKGPTGPDGPVGGDPVTVYNVTFDSNNDAETVNTVIVIAGGKIIPVSPSSGKTLAKTPLTTAGLYRNEYTFTGWYETDEEGEVADTPWDFDHPFTKDTTLKAGWESLNLIPTATEANFITNAFNYPNTNAADRAGLYVLYLDKDYTSANRQLVNTAGGTRQIKIVALQDDPESPVERKISLSNTGVFMILNNGNSVILDANVTIAGDFAGNNNSLVRIQGNAQLIMEEGSKITGNVTTVASGTALTGQTAGVLVDGGILIMKGGEISGMTMSSITSAAAGLAVCVVGDGSFIMEGGEIKDNTGNGLADVYIAENTASSDVAPLTLSGEAKPGTVALNVAGTSPAQRNRTIAIAEGWEGEISGLDLRYSVGNDMEHTFPGWGITLPGSKNGADGSVSATAPVIVTGADDYTLIAEDIEKIILRNFVGTNISTYDYIGAEGEEVVWSYTWRNVYGIDVSTGKLKIILP